MAFEPAPRMGWMKRLAWAAGIYVLLCALGWLIVPPVLQSQLQQRASAALGRQVTVGAVDFRPWSLLLTLKDIQVAGLAGEPPQIKIAQLQANLELESLLRFVPVLDALDIDAPQLRLKHLGAGRYDIDDVLERLKTPSGAPPGKPLEFALYNISLHGGALDFFDRERQHTVRQLEIGVPFLSNLDYRRSTVIKPHLSFELNGSAIDSGLQGTPFADSRAMSARLRIQGFDLKPYLPYLPADLAVKPTEGLLHADLQIAFTQSPKTAVTVSGALGADGLKLVDQAGVPLLQSKRIDAVLADTRPFEQVLALDSLRLDAPALRWVQRRSTGRLQVELLDAAPAGTQVKKEAEPAAPWKISLRELQIDKGQAQFRDETIKPAAELNVQDVALKASDLQWPALAPATLEASLKLPYKNSAADLRLQGKGSWAQGSVHVELQQGALALANPWLAAYLTPSVAGALDAALDANWQDDKLHVAIARLAASDVALTSATPLPASGNAPRSGPSSNDMPRLQSLELRNAQIDLAARTARLGAVSLNKPSSGLRRNEDGRWTYQAWLKPQRASAPGSEKPWQISLDSLAIKDGSIAYADRSTLRPVRFDVSSLQLQAGATDLSGKQAVPLTLSALMRSGQTEPGSLRFKGDAAWAPLSLRGQIDAKDLPAHAVAPYLSDRLNLDIMRADASLKAQLQFTNTPQGAQLKLRGDAALEELRANAARRARSEDGSLVLGEELLSWKALSLPGLALDISRGAAMRLQIKETALTDFYARIDVSPEGRINLQDFWLDRSEKPAPADKAALPAQISMGPSSLVNGRVLFSDHFVKPNYSADLSQLTGKLGAFATQAPGAPLQLADIELRGRAEGTAALEILGKINPLADPLALDMRAQVRDLELPPLSPYAIKYSGYGIERGKLSMDASYKIDEQGQLVASNQLTLHQLRFGDEVPGAPNSLPVKLAVALLADADGTINLDVPVSGSLNDPQFSVGPVVWKIIKNIVLKALTAPFSLLGGGGSAEDGGRIAFAPGSSRLSAPAMQSLDKIAQGMANKTSLHITVSGSAHLEAERDGLKRALLDQQLLAEKRRRLAGDGKDATSITAVSEDEAPALLRTVYRRADINKPRNFLGLARDLEPKEMQALLLASIQVDADAMRALALARGVAVKDYLIAKKFPAERLFLGAAKVETAPDAQFQPAAELSLDQR